MEGQAQARKNMRPASLTNSTGKLSLPKAPSFKVCFALPATEELIHDTSHDSRHVMSLGKIWIPSVSYSFASLTKPHEKAKKLVSSTSKQAVVWISTDAIVQQLTLPHPGLFGSLAQSCQSIARCEPEQGSQKLHPCGATEPTCSESICRLGVLE